MSAPATPRSARALSHASNDGSPEILTPRRKIQALLAGFGSDSESEKDTNASRKAAPSLNIAASNLQGKDAEQANDADEDDLPRPTKGRLAARMQAENSEKEQSNNEEETAFDRVKRRFNTRTGEEQSTRAASATLSSSEDDAPVTTGKRRLLKHKQTEPTDSQSGSDRARSESPLFCSPYKPQEKRPDHTPVTRDSDDEDEDEQIEQPKNARFLALVEKKRKEREAKEKEEEAKRKRRAEIAKTIASDEISDASDDDLAGRKLTQSSKPTRKASKKALEAMNQETQRMSRNMQLEHQARTKKKITKESFFSRFNFGQQGSSSTVGSSNPPSAAESEKEHATPPTSPPRSPNEDTTKTTTIEPQLPEMPAVAEENGDLEGENLMSVEEILSNPNPPSEPQETHEQAQPRASTPVAAPKVSRRGPVRLKVSRESVAENQKDNSDSDLEVVTSPGKCRRIAAFENLPVRKAQDSDSMLKLRALAHLYSPSKRRQSTMTASEMQTSLRKQARLQAMKEREEKIQELKDKGIYVDTAEERARVEEDVEDLMEKARMEGEEISKREKQAAKKEGKSGPNGFDDEDDDDYDGGEEEELSGSDEEEDEEEEDEEDEDAAEGDAKAEENDGLVEDQADVAEESDDPIEDSAIEEDQAIAHTIAGRRKRGVRVISDDEDEEPELAPDQEAISQPQSAKKPQIPNLNTTEEPSLGLTQAFAATLGDSQGDVEQDSLAALRNMPDPGLINSAMLVPDSQEIVKDSQERPSEPIDLFAGYTQSDSRVSETPSKAQMFSQTQYSEIPEPTQDAGFVLSPFDQRNRFRDAPPSTEETVLLQNSQSPIAKRKGKLLRRRGPAEPAAQDEDDGFTIKASAFDVLRKKAKKVPQVFDKTKSNAREVVDEAAEESEDEYAGLGGASDDGEDEEDEYDQSMINDNSGEKVDEKELAALNANHVREQDEKQVSKLLKDITTGALRRKRGAGDDLDLSDSDDERLAARRRAKRREFNKMRKALLEDEKIGQIAENPKKLAFLRAIEDREPDDDIEIDFLQGRGSQEEGSKDEGASQETQAASSEESGGKNKRKRPLNPSAADTTNRPPPNKRRTVASKKPATLAEIRESVSFLLEGPDSGGQTPALDEESEGEGEDENAHRPKVDYFNRTVTRTPSADSAKPNSLTNMVGPSSKMAFQANKSTPDDSKPFSLIRHIAANSAVNISRANSSSSSSSTSSGFAAMRTVGRGGNGGEKKRGAVNYYTAAREKEREREMKRKEQGSGSRNIKSLLAGAAGLGALGGGGKWE